MQTDSIELLKQLVALPTPSGFEYPGMELLGKSLRQAGVQDIQIDRHGNLTSVLNKGAPLRVMLEGHCDEIGFMVQHIDDNGFLYMCPLGGVTIPTVASERIVIRGKNGPVYGVFGVRPPHLMTQEERKKVAPENLQKIAVDIGAKNKEDALQYVELGSPAVIDSGWHQLANNRVACRGFDNRVGAFIVTETARRLASQPLNVALYTVASVQEEVGLIGGYTTAHDIQPHIGICVDVTHASDATPDDRKAVGDIRIGDGPVLGIGPTYHRVLRARIEAAASAIEVPLQKQVRSRGTGTCAYAMRLTDSGAGVAQVSIPLRYMHSPVEVISLDDALHVVDVLVETIRNLPAELDLRPPQV